MGRPSLKYALFGMQASEDALVPARIADPLQDPELLQTAVPNTWISWIFSSPLSIYRSYRGIVPDGDLGRSDPRAYYLLLALIWMVAWFPPYALLWIVGLHRWWTWSTTRRIQSSTTLEPGKTWTDLDFIRGRQGLKVHVGFQVVGSKGQSLEMEVRFRSEAGDYIRGRLRAYRGSAGEFLADHTTAPLGGDRTGFDDLWVFCPTLALDLGSITSGGKLYSEVTVRRADGEFLLHGAEVPAEVLEEALQYQLPEQSSVEITMIATSPDQDPVCQICGDEVEGDASTCERCGAVSHSDCIEYLGRCSTYACEGYGTRSSGAADEA
jgi:hypothetical protein